jgi:hypothetical protein
MIADTFDVFEDVVVCKAQDSPSGVFKKCRARTVIADGGRLIVLRAVDLNNYFVGRTGEIDNVIADRKLAAKAEIHQAVSADCIPELQFAVRHNLAHGFRIGAIARRDKAMRHGAASCEKDCRLVQREAPPSVLSDISPTGGEIAGGAAFANRQH